MTTFTNDHLLLYAFNELNQEEKNILENELSKSTTLTFQLHEILKSIALIQDIDMEPNPKCLETILASTKVHSKISI